MLAAATADHGGAEGAPGGAPASAAAPAAAAAGKRRHGEAAVGAQHTRNFSAGAGLRKPCVRVGAFDVCWGRGAGGHLCSPILKKDITTYCIVVVYTY